MIMIVSKYMISNKQMFIEIIGEMKDGSNHIGHLKQTIKNYCKQGFYVNTKYIKGRNLGHYVVKYDLPKLVGFLKKQGLNLDLCDDNYDAPIHKAIREKNAMVLKELIKNNVDINIATEFDETPLHVAVSENNYEMVKILLDGGADLSLVDERNCTPLDYALDEQNEQIINLLKKGRREKK